jgi:hypothetical protein
MPKFRKKPVVIEAFRLTDNFADEPEWFEAKHYEHAAETERVVLFDDGSVSIKTLEGVMIARPGDWIIRGVQGELYPCKPDIFATTYEPVD